MLNHLSKCLVIGLFSISFSFYSCHKDSVSPAKNSSGNTGNTGNAAAPVINSIAPASAYATDTITISGSNFSSDTSQLKVSFSGTNGKIVSSSDTQIKVIIPLALFATNPTVYVTKGGSTASLGNALTILGAGFSLYQMSPTTGSPGQVIQFYGTNFSSTSVISVTFNDNLPGVVKNVSNGYFEVTVPQFTKTGYIKITIAGKSAPSPTSFTIISGGFWNPIPNAKYAGSLNGTDSMNGLTIGDNVIVGFGVMNMWTRDMWKFNTTTKTWTQLATFPSDPRAQPFTFVINGTGYIGSGMNLYNTYVSDCWSYDASADKWTQLANFPGPAREAAVSFSINGKGYVGMGDYMNTAFKDFWEYDPAANTWTQLADFPGAARTSAGVFVIDSKAYVAGGFSTDYLSDVWMFDATTNTWTQKASLPNARTMHTAFALTGKGVVTGGYNYNDGPLRDTQVYDPTTNTWTRYANFYGYSFNNSYATSIGSLGYVFGGQGDVDGTVYTFSF